MNRLFLLRIGGYAIAAILSAASASAEFITMTNPSFEDPVVADGQSASTYGASGLHYGWGAKGNAYWHQISNLYETWFPGATGNSTPPNGDGANAWIVCTKGGQEGYVVQDLSESVQVGTYTLTAAIGYPAASPYYPIDVMLGISTTTLGWTGPGLCRTSLTPAEVGSSGLLRDFSTSITIEAGDSRIGETLQIYVGADNNTTSTTGNATAFDNLRLTFVAAEAPEPTASVLLITGIVGLVCYAWKKRR